jgi:pSer/pThr/pTyr-binding forkhead associated (FHA) protein
VALTIVIKEEDSKEELSLTFDSSRVAIGRGKSCDLILPDPSVSKRHASIRCEGGRTLIVDEGSTNGLLVDRVKLAAQAPRAVSDGNLVRVGRVWLEVRQAGGVASATQEARRVALELLRRQLTREGEDATAAITIVGSSAAADEQRLTLGDSGREYTIGRARDCDLALDDELASRQHACVLWQGDGWSVRDLASKQGSFLRHPSSEEGPSELSLGERPQPWKNGEIVRIGNTLLRLTDPLSQAFEEVLAASDAKMRVEEFREEPPGRAALSEPPIARAAEPGVTPPGDNDEDDEPDHDLQRTSARPDERARGAGLAAVDTVIILVALGVLGLSLGGLFWLLR